MKQLLIFLLLLGLSLAIDMRKVHLNPADEINVSVTGAVKEERQIKLPLYSTVDDLLKKDILADDADTSALNPDMILKDHDVVNIPYLNEEGHSELISINTAGVEELCELDGIGKAMAQRIIDYRNENGLFQKTDDLLNVKGIGEAKLNKIRDQICL